VSIRSGWRGHAHLWVWAGECRDILSAEDAQIVGQLRGYGPGDSADLTCA